MSDAVVNDKPTVLPVLLGVGAITFGVFNGFCFTLYSMAVLLYQPENGPPIGNLIPGFLVLMSICSLLQFPAGVGILLHRPWGKRLVGAMAFGTVLTGGLGSAMAVLNLTGGYSDAVMGIFSWGFLTGIVFTILMNLAFRARSMKVVFGEVR